MDEWLAGILAEAAPDLKFSEDGSPLLITPEQLSDIIRVAHSRGVEAMFHDEM